MKDDYHVLGRSYFPNVDISEFTYHGTEQTELGLNNEKNDK